MNLRLLADAENDIESVGHSRIATASPSQMSDDPQTSNSPLRPPGDIIITDTGDITNALESRVISSSPPVPKPPPDDDQRAPARSPRPWLPLVLFLCTCATTLMVGSINFTVWFPVVIAVHDPATGRNYRYPVVNPLTNQVLELPDLRRSFQNGLTYAVAVMLMLSAHEAGHYLQARRYGVPGSLPMFIPMPIGPIGTMGAVIFQEPGVANRKSLFDIAISGPLAGLLVALPLNWWGVKYSQIVEMKAGSGGFTNPRIVEWMIAWIHGPLEHGNDIALTPILHAGWVGIFITSLNLMPIGQLDGGHLLYCLIGRKAHRVAQALYFGSVAFVLYQIFRGNSDYVVWILMLVLVGLMGPRHPPTSDDTVPLGLPRIILGWLTLAFVLVGFVSLPMYTTPPPEKPAATVQPAAADQPPATPQPANQPQGSGQTE